MTNAIPEPMLKLTLTLGGSDMAGCWFFSVITLLVLAAGYAAWRSAYD